LSTKATGVISAGIMVVFLGGGTFSRIQLGWDAGHGSSQWNDATSQNAVLENKLETWLYEQIEDELKIP